MKKKLTKKNIIIVVVVIAVIVLAYILWKRKKNNEVSGYQAQAPQLPSSSTGSGYSYPQSSTPTPKLNPYLDYNKTLRLGVQGAEVEELQKLLNDSGASPRLSEDGAFGSKTEEALKYYSGKSTIRLSDLPQYSYANTNQWWDI